jgi:hypothetical protein
MRRLVTLLAAAAAVLSLPTVTATADPAMRMNVPGNELAPYRAVAAQFSDPQAALDAGYVPITDNAGISCIADPAGSGAMGVHYVNVGRLLDGTLDPDQPEAVVYEPRADGRLHLVALEYIVVQADFGATAPEFFAGHPFDATGTPNRFDLPAFWSQHVWVAKGNPLGDLAMWNPNVHCG